MDTYRCLWMSENGGDLFLPSVERKAQRHSSFPLQLYAQTRRRRSCLSQHINRPILWEAPLNEFIDQTHLHPIFPFPFPFRVSSLSIVKCTKSRSLRTVFFSLFRSVIHATHREGERDTTDWCEWTLDLFFPPKNGNFEVSTYVSFSFVHSHRLYYRPSCHLWWPVTASSTLLGSSKTWTPPQSWKTSR